MQIFLMLELVVYIITTRFKCLINNILFVLEF